MSQRHTISSHSAEWRKQIASVIPAFALVTVVLLGARSLLSGPSSAAPPKDPAPPVAPRRFASGPIRGNVGAPVGIVVYSEFQCPFCAQFANATFPRLDSEYIKSGRVAITFRHLPIDAIHSYAIQAATGAVCAEEQGRFWEMHDRLFVLQPTLIAETPAAVATELNLDLTRWRACVGGRGAEKVRTDKEEAAALGLSKTPSFLIGVLRDGELYVRRVIVGVRPFEEFAATINRLLPTPATGARTND